MNTLPSTELLGSSQIEIHYTRPPLSDIYHVTHSRSASAILRKHINESQLDFRETFWVISLSNSNRVIGITEIATGTPTKVLINKRYIFQIALLTNASGIIIAHNHPSGKLESSRCDRAITQDIKKLAFLMEITLLDHLIITSESYYSMADEGEM
ncbi:JAB domain-containing protein [Polaribacter pectinis]|uniref:JAB domain-containing protein n=1 Tax=Polaribacter pectinis TaxID=2738844 RepID=A0A7G9L8F8_9FLAO|nr:JAB domain-containing protein [Polaribacter pectinis]QNM84907.1 JAB domain-containing protein [Polaribacter pectinis]